jgi:hypothetical protein
MISLKLSKPLSFTPEPCLGPWSHTTRLELHKTLELGEEGRGELGRMTDPNAL